MEYYLVTNRKGLFSQATTWIFAFFSATEN